MIDDKVHCRNVQTPEIIGKMVALNTAEENSKLLNSLNYSITRCVCETLMPKLGWLFWRIYVASAVFNPYRDFEAGDNQSLKLKWRGGESNAQAAIKSKMTLTH